eukprot:2961168-Pleurochrysis_carterae.AAC.3
MIAFRTRQLQQPAKELVQVLELRLGWPQRLGREIASWQRRQISLAKQPLLIVEQLELIQHRLHHDEAVSVGVAPAVAGAVRRRLRLRPLVRSKRLTRHLQHRLHVGPRGRIGLQHGAHELAQRLRVVRR